MTTHMIDQSITAKWEDGEYGRSEDHVAVAPQSVHEEFDKAMAMKLVSIRLPSALIESLKMIAEHHGIAYQPMIRDLLTRFARSEFSQIVYEMDEKMKATQSAEEVSAPVEAFMQRARAACG
ncbi:hypothetical protein ABB26_10110 [Stenotrophomonas humi]|uniref:Uncharacterized protein n=1 Tax=Stenotrophomonas humi TaxID=405444 RepID=A0A0R0CB52_9GAMM|nr:CopG family antitoxin [Stenotrophomonas humi]KRG63922.1 hypothetical protein ABB26_10110 [Stenotrophomonas humi]